MDIILVPGLWLDASSWDAVVPHLVPATATCPEYTCADLREWIAGGELPELARTADLDLVDLPGGHWPQPTQPEALAAALIEAAAH